MTRTWQRALVTGASSGIGRAIATELASEGTDLVIVARDAARLGELANELDVDVDVLPADLADPAGIAAVADRIASTDDPIDLLVNNAGLGFAGPFVDIPADQSRLVVDVNVVALHELCQAATSAMPGRGGGAILNVSSIAGDLPGVGSATYNATKAFVTSFSESLHVELASLGVTVTALCPGLTRTEFQDRAGVDDLGLPDAAWQSAETVARVGLDATKAGRPIVISGALNKLASRMTRSAPRSVARAISARMARP